MTKIVSCVFLFIALSSFAHAQNVPIVPLDSAMFTWEWNGGPYELLEGVKIKCGPDTGSYNIIVDIPGTGGSTLVKNVIQNAEKNYCTISAYNRYSESANSNEIVFIAEIPPSYQPFLQ